ncbi:MAG: peptide ABC transporter substrate-binding protein [Clostridium sp.]
MLKKRLSKVVAVGLTAVLMTISLAGCGSSGKPDNTVVINISEEEKTIDPALNESSYAGSLIDNSFEALTRLDDNQQPQPAVAESWTVSPDGLVYSFKLRQNAKWSDDKPVTAKDFAFAWKRVLTKETAAPYSGYLMYIKGAQDFFDGKAKDVAGIKVKDDYNIEVTLEHPVSYFLQLTAFTPYMPVREDVVGDASWATKPETYISNGPLVLKEWRPKDIMVYEKNPHYWNPEVVKLDRLEVKMIAEPSNALNAFKTGELDYIEKPPAQEIPNLLKDGTAIQSMNIGTYMYLFNLSDKMKQKNPAAYKAMSDAKVRKALALALDRKAIIETATKGGEVPATSIVPPGIKNSKGEDFRTKDYIPVNGNVEEAKKLLAEAGFPEGKGFPQIELLYNVGSGHEQVAQAMQEMWRKNLGINVKLSNQEWKVFLDSKSKKDFEMCRMGWIADYTDPSTFLKLFETNGENNDTGYSNKEVDDLIKKAASEVDEAKRTDLYRQAEAIIMEAMPAIPVYYYTDVICINPKVKGIKKSPLGRILLYGATKEA